jgi:hypothetical protein
MFVNHGGRKHESNQVCLAQVERCEFSGRKPLRKLWALVFSQASLRAVKLRLQPKSAFGEMVHASP